MDLMETCALGWVNLIHDALLILNSTRSNPSFTSRLQLNQPMVLDSVETLSSQRGYRIHSLDMSRELYHMASILRLYP